MTVDCADLRRATSTSRLLAKGDVMARTHVGDVDVELPPGHLRHRAGHAVGDSDVEGVIDSDQARHAVEARADVGTVDVTAR